MTDEKTAAPAKKVTAGDTYIADLEDAASALRGLILTLEGAPGVSQYTNAALVEGRRALAALDGG